MTGVLDGVTVLDFSHALSGPTLTRYLVEMGASVIKVEAPPGGDITRRSAAVRDGRSGYFVTVNRGKHSLCIDLKDERGRAAVLDLIPSVDVVVQNFRAGTLDRLGLGYERLRDRNPAVVLCSISGFGAEGPLSHLAGYDGVAQAYAGITSLNSADDGSPTLNGAAVGDVMTGVNGVAAVLGALLWRERTGEGQHVEVSLVGSYMQAHDSSIQAHSVSGGEVVQRGSGRLHPFACPYGIFSTPGGHVFVCAAADHHWRDLCDAMGRPELAGPDHPWSVRHSREEDRDRVNSVVEEWTSSQPSRDDAVAVLQAHRVPVGPVLGIDEVVEHDGLRAAGMVATATDPVLGELAVPGFPVRFSAARDPGDDDGPRPEAPFLGEHNREVLTGLGGMTPRDYDRLIESGVVTAEPVPGRPSRRGPARF